jgi:hypothetical protein
MTWIFIIIGVLYGVIREYHMEATYKSYNSHEDEIEKTLRTGAIILSQEGFIRRHVKPKADVAEWLG